MRVPSEQARGAVGAALRVDEAVVAERIEPIERGRGRRRHASGGALLVLTGRKRSPGCLPHTVCVRIMACCPAIAPLLALRVAMRSLLLMGLSAATFGAIAAQAEAVSKPLLERIDAFVESERAASRIPGIALAVVDNGRIVHVRGFGTRGDGSQPVTGDTPFPVGSLGKSFTALLARQLADAGQLDLDAPVARVLPAFTLADAAAAQRVTVRHLLNQTSGLSRTDGMRPLLSGDDAQGAAALLRSMASLRLRAAPGERYEYSNLNFALLGQVVEGVTHQPWEQVLRQRLFEPLQMTRSHTGMREAAADGMTELHRYWFGLPVAQRIEFPRALAPAGGTAASAQDMARYLLMMLNAGQGPRGRVLSEAAARSMLTVASPPGRSTLLGTRFDFRYGEGWFVGPFGAADDARWHLGSLASFAAWMVLLPNMQQGVVVLINANSELPLFGAGDAFSRIPIGVVNLLRGQPAPTGSTVTDAYLRLNTVLALIGAAVVCVSWVIARRRWRWAAIAWAAAAVTLGLALTFTTFGWRGFAQFMPDVVTWLVTMLTVMLVPAALSVRRPKLGGARLSASGARTSVWPPRWPPRSRAPRRSAPPTAAAGAARSRAAAPALRCRAGPARAAPPPLWRPAAAARGGCGSAAGACAAAAARRVRSAARP